MKSIALGMGIWIGIVCGAAAETPAREGGPPIRPRTPPFSIETAALGIAPADARGGGRWSAYEYGGGAGNRFGTPIGTVRLGAGWRRARFDADGLNHPVWNELEGDYERWSVNVFFLRPGRWTWSAMADLETAHRAGADPADGLSAFALVAAQTRVSPKLKLGGGALALFSLDRDPLVLPIPLIEYQWNAEWSLALERGVTLRRRPGGGPHSFFLTLIPERHRYRLPDDAPAAPGGVFAHYRIDARAGWEGPVARGARLRAFIGTAAGQEFLIKDADRRTLRSERADPAFTAGIEATFAF